MIIYYWAPCLNKVGTYKSTMHSAIALAKYSKKNKIRVINSCGEWNEQRDFFEEHDVELIDLGFDYFKYLPKLGFFGSRFSYLIIFITSFIPLLKIILNHRPDFLIIHLITSLPLLLNKIFKNKSKIILRISGYPKLNFVRRFFWKLNGKNVFKITCPSIDLRSQLMDLNIFEKKKIQFLADPIIRVKEFREKILNISKQDLIYKKRYFISVGRLTRQKNFKYLIEEFKTFSGDNEEIDLLIFGEGEDKNLLSKLIKKNKLEDRIRLMGYSNNIFQYMKNSQAFILSSLWEDPGFVLIEAAMCNSFIISSNCKNGPEELLNKGAGGLLFENNKKGDLAKKLNEFLELGKRKKKMKLITKKNILQYTLYRHFQVFMKIIN